MRSKTLVPVTASASIIPGAITGRVAMQGKNGGIVRTGRPNKTAARIREAPKVTRQRSGNGARESVCISMAAEDLRLIDALAKSHGLERSAYLVTCGLAGGTVKRAELELAAWRTRAGK